jgi:hypothetical protein
VTLSVVEQTFLHRWKSIDFSNWNETSVREGFLIELLHVLGYRKGTTYDVEFEKSLKLSNLFHRVGRKKVRIDYAPSIRKRHFWIIEAKPGKERELDFGDLLQAHLYAIHPEVQARLLVLSNGWQLRVYDALTIQSFEDALLVVDQGTCEQTFAELRDMVGSQKMLAYQRTRVVDIIRNTLASEVDVEVVKSFRSEFSAMLFSEEQKVAKNAEALWMADFGRRLAEEQQGLEDASLPVLLMEMDRPETGGRPQTTREFVRRVSESDQEAKAVLVQRLLDDYYGRPHNVFRVQTLSVLLKLAEHGVDPGPVRLASSLKEAIEHVARSNIVYVDWHPLSNALCHLDNVALRVASRLCARAGGDYLMEIEVERRGAMTPKERIAERPSPEELILPTIGHVQEVFWRRYVSKGSPEEVLEGVWCLEQLESELAKLPAHNLGGEAFYSAMFEFVGVSHDHLRVGTWNVLRREAEGLRRAGVADDVHAFAQRSHDEIISDDSAAAAAARRLEAL